jgi:uncharacterized protein YgbK (DUF1537 family)
MASGILLINGKLLTLAKNTFNENLPIMESNVVKFIKRQSSHKIGWIELGHVAENRNFLKSAVKREVAKKKHVLIFDAVRSKDLKNIADVAFNLKQKPLIVGSAGLAKEVVGMMAPPKKEISFEIV